MPTTPQADAGMRMEPPVSDPSAPNIMPAATAIPDPLLEPPLARDVFHGLRPGPN